VANFRKILIANRGEIAVRVIRTCREMGIGTVAIYSDADRAALHVRMADEAYRIGPPPARESYLSMDALLDIAKRSGADAVHPGYGFLSENPAFARACSNAGIVFIGPPATAMEEMGEKTRARSRMRTAGIPIVPGSDGPISDSAEAAVAAARIGFPVMVKAAAGGGGKGMKRVERPDDFAAAFASAQREALSAFGDGRVYLEKFLDRPRHIEIQVFADTLGACIHLGERECSVQRRHQKVIEETPSAVIDAAMREQMGEVAVKAAKAVGYVGAGTVEFLVDARRAFYFLEMNTRLQVEHPVTELVTGVDLVRWQIAVAQGSKLPMEKPLLQRGHAIEARVYAEDPSRDFMPSPGRIDYLGSPGGPGVRDDSGVYAGYEVPRFYDPMLSKLAVWAQTRNDAIDRLRRALSEYVVKGIRTNVAYLRRVLALEEFRSGDYDTGILGRHHKALVAPNGRALEEVALVAAAVHAFERDKQRARSLVTAHSPEGSRWRMAGRRSWAREDD
jgi:acetyl-CoA carboxylase, biotin carboxylase subunit